MNGAKKYFSTFVEFTLDFCTHPVFIKRLLTFSSKAHKIGETKGGVQMLLLEAREQVVHYGKELARRGLATGSFGNLSIYVPETKVLVISPSGVDYDRMTPGDVAVLTMDGVLLEGGRKPSSEVDLHRAVYERRPDVLAVVHTHSPYATTMACLGKPLRPLHYAAAYAGGETPCIPYYPFGTKELADAAAEAMGTDRNAVLLGGHGLLTAGETLSLAMDAAEQLEFLAQICWRCELAGGGNLLTEEQMAHAAAALKDRGQKK
ncbi:MAG: class II aldolase/adducin family protein [Muribaculaceae bacterium]|nr:class II aldolase/adducin family protein [Muribaculaceae bacterium]